MRICIIAGCDKKHKGLGYCERHYKSFKLYGDPFATATNFEWLNQQLSIDHGDQCQEWPFGILEGYGYGVVKYNGNSRRVQKVSFELVKGSVSEGLVVTNSCGNILCFNPNHLQQENRSRTSRCAKKTFCLHGHPLEGDNLREMSNGGRICKICSNKRVNIAHKVRRALKMGCEATLTNTEWEEILSDYGGLCAYCGDIATGQDHIIPLCRGGSHSAENVVPACTYCNSSKGTKTQVEWVSTKLTQGSDSLTFMVEVTGGVELSLVSVPPVPRVEA